MSSLGKTFSYQPELGTFGIFKFFDNKKWYFALFLKLTWLGFLNRTGAEIGY